MTWPGYAEQDWIEMQRDNAAYAADMDEDFQRITYGQVKEFEMIKRYVDFDGERERAFNRHELDYPEPTRARRIRDKQRMKARARRIFTKFHETRIDFWRSNEDRLRWTKACEHLADHLAHCNRWCCNKRRKHEGPPIQEIREAMRADETILS